MTKILKLEMWISDSMAESISQDFTHMQTPHGRLSWVKLPVNGQSLVSWEVTDAAGRPRSAEAVPEAEEA